MQIECTVNSRHVRLDIDPQERVIHVLRAVLGLTGTKESCGAGECGACSIVVNGEVKLACLMLAVQLDRAEILTIEGIAVHEKYSAIPEELERTGAVQCGYCTPGMAASALDLLASTPRPSRVRVREALSGNLCRCTGYQKIVDGVMNASRRLSENAE